MVYRSLPRNTNNSLFKKNADRSLDCLIFDMLQPERLYSCQTLYVILRANCLLHHPHSFTILFVPLRNSFTLNFIFLHNLFCLHSTTNNNARFEPNQFIFGVPDENQPEPHSFTYTILQSLFTSKTHSNTRISKLLLQNTSIVNQFSLSISNLIKWLALHIVATTSTRQGDRAPVRRNLQSKPTPWPTFHSKLSGLVPVRLPVRLGSNS